MEGVVIRFWLLSEGGAGGGPSPNSAISDIYSSSILALSPAAGGPPRPGLFDLQSLAMCPAAPQLEHIMLFVTFGLSGHSHDL